MIGLDGNEEEAEVSHSNATKSRWYIYDYIFILRLHYSPACAEGIYTYIFHNHVLL